MTWTLSDYDRLFKDHPPTEPTAPHGEDLAAIASDLHGSIGAIAVQWDDARSAVLGNKTAASGRLAKVLGEVLQVRGLMPLLMKPRNSQRWTPDDKTELAQHLKRLSQLSPYLAVVVMPGGFLMLPAIAWWLDRRRNRHAPPLAR